MALTLRQKFNRFHKKNPSVLEDLTKLAMTAKDRGYDRYSINGLFEILRWERNITLSELDDREPFKLNNSYRSFYARMIMRKNKDLKDFFEVRTMTSTT